MDDSPSDAADRADLRAKITAEKAALRNRLVEKLIDEGENAFAAKLAKCGNPLELTCTCCGRAKTVLTKCDLKWCPSCQSRLAARTVERFAAAVEKMSWPTLVTLTVKNYRKADESMLFVRNVRAAFTRMRRLRWWKRAVRGGVACIEVTNRGKGWHPHVHALIDCRWLSVTEPAPGRCDQSQVKAKGTRACKEVAQQWELCTKRKGSCHVRRVYSSDQGDIRKGLMEVAKYSVKGSELVTIKVPVGTLIRQLAATRLTVSWGSMYRLGKVAKKGGCSPCDCGAMGEFIPTEFIQRPTR